MTDDDVSRWKLLRAGAFRWLVRGFVGLLVLAGLVWVVAARGMGMQTLVPWLLSRAVPEGWAVEVAEVEGAWSSGATLAQLSLVGPSTSVHVQEVHLGYRLGPLLDRRVHVTDLRLVRPRVELVRKDGRSGVERDGPGAEGGGGGLADILGGSPLGGWTASADHIGIRDGEIHADLPHQSYDAEAAHLSASATWAPDGLDVSIDSLGSRVRALTRPGTSASKVSDHADTDPLEGHLSLAASLHDGVLALEDLVLSTPHGGLRGDGTVPLLIRRDAPRTVTLSLHGTDLDLRRLPVEVPPPLQSLPFLTLDARIRGDRGSSVDVSVELRANPDTASPASDPERTASTAGGFLEARVEGTLDQWSPTAALDADATVTYVPADGSEGRPGDLLGGPLRVEMTATRTEQAPSPAADLTVELDLQRSADAPAGDPGGLRWNDVGRVDGELGTDTASWSLELRPEPAAVLEGEGSVSWTDGALRIATDRLRFEELDLSALYAAWPETSLSGRLDGRVSGTSATSLAGDVRATLARSSVAESSVDSLDLTARLEPSTFGGRLYAARSDVELASDYSVTLTDSLVRARADDLTLAGAQAALRVEGHAEGTWALDAAPPRGSATLTVDSASVADLRLRSARVDADLQDDSVTATLGAEVLDVLADPLRVHGTLGSRGFDPTVANGALELRVARLAGETESPADSLLATLTARGEGRFVLEGELLPAGQGRVALSGEAALGESGWSFDASARGSLQQLDFLGGARLDSLRLEASAEQTVEGWQAARADLSATGAAWNAVTVDTLRASARLDSLGLVLDTLVLASNVADLRGGGRVPARGVDSSAIRLRGSLADLGPLVAPDDTASVSMGRSELQATVSGNLDSLALAASADVRALVYGSLRASGLDVSSTALLATTDSAGRELRGASVELGIDRLALPDTEVRRIDLTAEGGPESLRLDAEALVDDSRRGTLHARVDRLSDRRRATLERLDLQLDDDRWALVDSALVDYEDAGGYALRSFLLRSGDQEIEIDGSVGADGALDVMVDADSVDVGTVADLVGLPGVDGWLGGRTLLDGTTERPTGRAYLRGALHLPSAPPAPARISIRSDGSRVRADVDLHSEAEGHLRLDGSVRIPGTPAPDDSEEGPPLDVRLVSEEFRLTALQPFFDAGTVTGLDGVLEADLRFRGTLDEPDTEGSVRVRQGRMRLPPLGVDYRALRADISARGSELVVDSVRMESGQGYASFAGTVSLAAPHPIDLAAYLSGFQAIRTDAYHGTVSGRMTASGDVRQPVLNGDVDIESLDVFLGGRVESRDLEDVELTEEDLRMLRDRFGYVPGTEDDRATPLLDRLTADLVVHLGRDSWLRNQSSPEMSVPFTGDVDVRMRPGEPVSLQGQVTTIANRGFVEQFGRRFDLREGTVTFDGPPEATRLDLSATYTIPSRDNPDDAEATIVLSVEGTQQSLSLELSSEPPMENADIVSYIATGRPAAGALSFQGSDEDGGLAEAGAGLALGQLAGIIESAAGQSVGLDVVEIRREGLREATLVAGKYLSPRLYVGFAQPITLREGDGLSFGDEGESEIEIEIEALRWLLLNIEGSSSAVRLFLKGRYAY